MQITIYNQDYEKVKAIIEELHRYKRGHMQTKDILNLKQLQVNFDNMRKEVIKELQKEKKSKMKRVKK